MHDHPAWAAPVYADTAMLHSQLFNSNAILHDMTLHYIRDF